MQTRLAVFMLLALLTMGNTTGYAQDKAEKVTADQQEELVEIVAFIAVDHRIAAYSDGCHIVKHTAAHRRSTAGDGGICQCYIAAGGNVQICATARCRTAGNSGIGHIQLRAAQGVDGATLVPSRPCSRCCRAWS